ncbi:glycosyltransferase family 4 protein [Roseibium sp. SCPC15]|uniref:glycosyltransferase family 4 protein n=1 Tax=Roseibium sp. SCP15 TaxID=3141376 RepID=UPI00333973AB
MPKLVFAYPGDIDTPTGGYGYDRRIIAGLRALGWQVDLLPLGPGFPFPSVQTLECARRKLEDLPSETCLVVDGLAFGVLAEAAEAVSPRVTLIALVHHPLCQENGLGSGQSEALHASERLALGFVQHVIVTSSATATQVEDLFAIPKEQITVILPGTERQPPCPRQASETLNLLAVGTVVRRKGYDLLFEALKTLPMHNWHLDIVGGLDADPNYHRSLLAQADASGIADRVTFHDAVSPDELSGFYQSADVFVLASRYEGYGMAYTEALAHGLPVIGSGGGAVRDTLPDEAAIYCGTENVDLLRAALERVMTNRAKRSAMAEAAEAAALKLPTWEDAAARFADVLKVATT